MDMHVLYDYQIFCRQRFGGISRYFYELIARSLVNSEIQPFCFQGLHVNQYDIRKLFGASGTCPGLYHRKIPCTGWFLSRLNGVVFKRWAGKQTRVFDIYHPTYYGNTGFVSKKRKKTVLTVYDMIHEKFSSRLSGADRISRGKKICIEEADRIIAISNNTKTDLIECFGVAPEKITVVYLAAGPEFVSATNGDCLRFCRQHGLEKPFILFVGERSGYKNFSTLLKAYEGWDGRPDFDLVCAGGSRGWSPEEARYLKKYRLQNSVRLFTAVDDNILRHFYSCAYVYVIPSLYEGFGIPPLEAMACGAPVIASSVSSIPEVVGDAGLYFEPLSTEQLCSCFSRLADNKQLRAELVRKGTEQAGRFSWDRTASETFTVYREVLS